MFVGGIQIFQSFFVGGRSPVAPSANPGAALGTSGGRFRSFLFAAGPSPFAPSVSLGAVLLDATVFCGGVRFVLDARRLGFFLGGRVRSHRVRLGHSQQSSSGLSH